MKTFGRCFGEGGLVQQGARLNLSFTSANTFSAAENQTAVGTVIATPVGCSYSIVAGGDGASFVVNSSTGILTFIAAPDFEVKNSYTVTVRATKGSATKDQTITVSVTNVNEAPTNMTLTASTIPENAAINTVIGTFGTADPDVGDTHVYTFVSGTGSTDNASFNISGNSLRSSAVFDFETKSSYSIRVRETDAGGLYFEQTFTITVTDVFEEPAILSDGNTVAWYDYTQPLTITKDGSNFVSRWNDRLGSGRDLIQAIGTNQPLINADGILFDGIDNFMTAQAFTYNQPHHIYIVVNNIAYKQYSYLFFGDTVGLRFLDSGVINNYELNAGNSNQFSGAVYNQFVILRLLINGANSNIKSNQNVLFTGNAGTSNMGGFKLGYNSSTNYKNIKFKEAILRKVADNSTDETAIYNYLKTKYSL